MTWLAGDIGGTNARFALVAEDGLVESVTVYDVASFTSAEELFDAFIGEAKPGRLAGVTLAVAGPARDGRIRLTNGVLEFDAERLGKRLDAPVGLINDFAGVAHGVSQLAPDDCVRLGGVPGEGVRLVIGPGTGLGMALLAPDTGGYQVLPSEGGHADFAATNALETEIVGLVAAETGHVSWETLISGPGLERLYDAVCRLWGVTPDARDPKEITRRAIDENEPQSHQTLDIFCGALGNVAGNMAVSVCATGGVFLVGRIVNVLGAYLESSAFRRRFEERGAMTSYVSGIAIYRVADELVGLRGAARLAVSRTAAGSARLRPDTDSPA